MQAVMATIIIALHDGGVIKMANLFVAKGELTRGKF
jgi:hypothetical protein